MGKQISITSIEEFDKIVENLNNELNKIKESFDSESNNMKKILDNKEVWSGKARDKANEKYEKMTNIYPKVTQSLENYVSFLKDTSNRYKELEKSTNDAIEKYSNELNVN